MTKPKKFFFSLSPIPTDELVAVLWFHGVGASAIAIVNIDNSIGTIRANQHQVQLSDLTSATQWLHGIRSQITHSGGHTLQLGGKSETLKGMDPNITTLYQFTCNVCLGKK